MEQHSAGKAAASHGASTLKGYQMKTLFIKPRTLVLTNATIAANQLGLDEYDAKFSANAGNSLRKIWDSLDKEFVYLYGFKDVKTIESLRFDYESKDYLDAGWFEHNCYFLEGVFITSKDEDPSNSAIEEGMTTEEFKDVVYELIGTDKITPEILSNVSIKTTCYGKLELRYGR